MWPGGQTVRDRWSVQERPQRPHQQSGAARLRPRHSSIHNCDASAPDSQITLDDIFELFFETRPATAQADLDGLTTDAETQRDGFVIQAFVDPQA